MLNHYDHENIERHTMDTIVSWPYTKQWVIVHTSDLMMIARQSIDILLIIPRGMGKLKTHSPTYCIMDNGENMLNLTHTRQNISDRHFISSMPSDKFAQWWKWDGVLNKQTSTNFKPKHIRIFALIMIIMKTNSRFSRNVYPNSQTNEITGYRCMETQSMVNDIKRETSRSWCNKHLRHTTTEKYDNNGKVGYFRFDDDNNMSYRYILSITYTEMGQLNIYNPIYCNENER